MIKYTLSCASGCRFEAWFRNSAACDEQLAANQVACPNCGAPAVGKALMAPNISVPAKAQNTAAEEPPPEAPATPPALNQRTFEHALRALRAHIEQTADNVGDAFAQEARRIHEGEGDLRPIYGDATPEEIEDLIEDDIPVARIPWIDRTDD